MVQESEWLSESHASLLGGPRSRQDLYKVQEYFTETIGGC